MWFKDVVIILTWIYFIFMVSKQFLRKRRYLNLVVISLSTIFLSIYVKRLIYGDMYGRNMQVSMLVFGYIIPLALIFIQYNNIRIRQRLVYILANISYRVKSYEVAAKLLKYITKRNRTSSKYFFMFGRALRKTHKYLDARDALIEAIELDKSNYLAYYELGLTLDESGKKETAIVMLSNCLKIKPDFVPAKEAIAIIYLEFRNYKEAISTYEEIVAAGEGHADIYYNLAIGYNEQGEIDRAEENYKKAIKYNRSLYEAYYALGKINYMKGDYEESIKYFIVARDSEKYKVKAYYNLAKAYSATKDYQKALVNLEYVFNVDETYKSIAQDEIIFEEIQPEINEIAGLIEYRKEA